MSEKIENYLIPYATYTDPEIATVGHNEKTLRALDIPFDVYAKHFNHNDRALCDSNEGVYKIYTAKGKDKILGASLAGGPAGDIIGLIGNAMTNKIGLKKLGSCTFPYPSYAEIFRNMSDSYIKSTITPGMKKVIKMIYL